MRRLLEAKGDAKGASAAVADARQTAEAAAAQGTQAPVLKRPGSSSTASCGSRSASKKQMTLLDLAARSRYKKVSHIGPCDNDLVGRMPCA